MMPRKPGTRPAAPVTATWLERVALHYLDRYSASSAMLRRVLARRVEKRAAARGEAPEDHAALVEEIVARAVRSGLVDDARFTAARLATLRRRGVSSRGAGAALAAKGVDRAIVAAALTQEHEADPDHDVEREAAEAYARRRRLGPYRSPEKRAAYRERDLAALGRAGFPYGLARSVIDAEGDDPASAPVDEPQT